MEITDPNRTALLLRYYEELSVGQIAAQLGVSTAVVKGQLRRGLDELRASLAARGKDDERQWRVDLAAVAAMPLPSMSSTVAMGALLLTTVSAVALVVASYMTGSGPERSTDLVGGSAGSNAGLGAFEAGEVLPGSIHEDVSEERSVVRGFHAGGGEMTLRIGDGFVFGDQEASPDGDRKSLDLLVQDIRHGVSLATLAGGSVPSQTMTSIGLPKDPKAALALVVDAPVELPKRDLWLLPEVTPDRVGIGFARSRAGQVYKLCLLDLNGHPEALKRTVRIAYEPVPAVEGGGFIRLPETTGKPSELNLAAIREALRIGRLIPGDTFAKYISGDYQELSGDLKGMTVTDQHLVFPMPVDVAVKIDGRVGVFAASGVPASGSITLESYGAIGVQGALEGTATVDSYGYLYVDGPVTGRVNLDSYSTVVLEKGLAGTLDMNSYSDILIRGQITGSIDASGSCWSTLYLDGFYSEWQLEEMSKASGDFDQITLHLRSSDLRDGEHEGVGDWRNVIVGDPVWDKLAR
tara:strand:+ start:14041 stop:15606 length:1566 start_codon:yes stop_codon:yes gene_type:complete